MPPQLPADPEDFTPDRTYSAEEFARHVRRAYPSLDAATPDDRRLTHVFLTVNPEFKSWVSVDPLEGSELAPAPAALPSGRFTPPPPPMPTSLETYPGTNPYEEFARTEATRLHQQATQETYTRQREPAIAAAYAAQKQQRERRQRVGLPPRPTGLALPPAEAPPPDALSAAVTSYAASPVIGAARALPEVPTLLQAMGQGAVAMEPGRLQPEPQLAGPEVAGSLTRFTTGGMEMSAWGIPPAFRAQPLPTALGLTIGTAITEGLHKLGTAMGITPEYVDLGSTLGGLAAGVWAARKTVQVETGRLKAQEMAAEQAAAAVQEAWKVEEARREAAATATHALYQKAQTNAQLNAAQQMFRSRPGSAFDYLSQLEKLGQPPVALPLPEIMESFARVPATPLTTTTAPPPSPLIGEVGEALGRQLEGQPTPPPRFTEAATQEQQGRRQLDEADRAATEQYQEGRPQTAPFRRTPVPEPPPPSLTQQVGTYLESTLRQPPRGLTPRPSPATGARMRGKLREQQSYLDAFERGMLNATSQMEEMPHQPGRHTREGHVTGEVDYFTPPVAGAPIYHDIVGHATVNPPSRSYITAIMQAWRETRAKTGKELLTAGEIDEQGQTAITRLMQRLGLKTEGGARRAYDTWIPEVRRAVDYHVRRQMETEAWRREAGEVDQPAATPPPEPIPNWAREDYVEPEMERLPREPLPGQAQFSGGEGPQAGVIGPATPPEPLPLAESAQAEPSSSATKPYTERTLFERLAGEEGHLILNISPSNKRGIRDWLDRHAEEYGETDWHQRAEEAIARDDYATAYRSMAIAVSHANAGSPRARDPETGEAKPSPIVVKSQAQIEAQIGRPLAKGEAVSPEGLITFPGPGGTITPATPRLKSAVTDLTMAKTLVQATLDVTDPTQLFKIPGNTDPNLRLNAQIADQIVRRMPREVLDPLMELAGTRDPMEFAKEFRRQANDAGRRLQMLSQFAVDHENDIYSLMPVGGGSGQMLAEDVLGLSRQPPSAFHKWLHTTATQADLDLLGFKLPPHIRMKTPSGDALTPEAKAYASRWLGKQRRMAEVGRTLDVLAKDGSDYDRAIMETSITAADLTRGGVFRELNNARRAFLISKLPTMLRNVRTQGIRYVFEVMDDALAGVYSYAAGNPEAANEYFTRAGYRIQGTGITSIPFIGESRGGGASLSLLKHPWLDSMEAVYNYKAEAMSGLPAKHAHNTLALIRSIPGAEARFMSTTGFGEFTAGGRVKSRFPPFNALMSPEVRNTVTVGTRLQEHSFRLAIADAVMRTQLAQRGYTPNVHFPSDRELVLKFGDQEVDRMVGASIAASLNETFASNPIPETAPDILMEFFSRNPVTAPLLQIGLPFPRFSFVSAPRWIWQHNPLAPIAEGLLFALPNRLRTDVGKSARLLRGQRYFGAVRQSLEGTTIPGLDAEIGRSQYDSAIALQKLMAAKDEALTAAKAFKTVIAQAEKSGILPEMQDALTEATTTMHEAMARDREHTTAYKATEQRTRDLGKQRKEALTYLQSLQETGVPKTQAEYYARLTIGAALFAVAYLLRSAPEAAKTKWNQWRYSAPDLPGLPGSGHTADVDLTSESPFVQYLLPADLAHDVAEHTDWDAVRQAVEADPSSLTTAIREHYTGKYTEGEFWKEAVQSYLTYSPAAGTSRDLLDLITGRSSGTTEAVSEKIPDALLSLLGQWIGGFTVPLQQVNDFVGQFRPEAAKARIPATGAEDQWQALQELAGPTLANIPYVREKTVPEKVSPLTGKAIQTVDPLARLLAGWTQREQSRFTEEINLTGVPYGTLVPHQFGDRQFDNVVSKHYHALLTEYIQPELLDNEDYQALTPALKRDQIGMVIGGIKRAAYYEAAEELKLDDDAAWEKITPKETQERRKRWMKYLDRLNKEADRDHPVQPEPQPEPQPRQSGGPVEPGEPYLVGEDGPEVIIPSEAGYVVPNARLLPHANIRQQSNERPQSNESSFINEPPPHGIYIPGWEMYAPQAETGIPPSGGPYMASAGGPYGDAEAAHAAAPVWGMKPGDVYLLMQLLGQQQQPSSPPPGPIQR